MRVSVKALLGAAFGLLLAGQADAQLFYGSLGDVTKLKDGPNFDYGGWVQLGWQDRADGAFTGNGPGGQGTGNALYQNEHGTVQLNQLYAYVAKVADGSNGIDWGFRVDSMFGVDGNEGQAFGNVNAGHWDYLHGFGGPGDTDPKGPYELAFPQAYLEVATGDLTTKVGRFYTPVGYEVVTSPNNFFLSRQLTFYNSEPFTHTGIQSTYRVSDSFSFNGGWVYGWDTGFYQYHNGGAFMGGFTWQLTDNHSLTYHMCGGNLGWRGQGAVNSWVLTSKNTERWTSVLQFDVLGTNLSVDATGVPYGPTGALVDADFQTAAGGFIARHSTGVIGYNFFKLTDKVSIGTRGEWYKADGTSYFTNTYGVNWKPHANLLIRPEARQNYSPGDKRELYHNHWVLGCDAILLF